MFLTLQSRPGFSCHQLEARFSPSIAAQPQLQSSTKLLTGEKEIWESPEQSHEDGRSNTVGRGNVFEMEIVSSSRTQRKKH